MDGKSGFEGEVKEQRDCFMSVDLNLLDGGGCACKENGYAQGFEGSFMEGHFKLKNEEINKVLYSVI